jgi:hypothetical protein
MPQTTTLYRGQISTSTDGSGKIGQTLFTLPSTGFIAAKIILSRMVIQLVSPQPGENTGNTVYLIHQSSAGGDFPLSVNQHGASSINSLAITPAENNGGPVAYFNNVGNTAYTAGLLYITGAHTFGSNNVLNQIYWNTSSSSNHVPKIFWMGPGDSVFLRVFNATVNKSLTIDYLFTAISET